MRGMLIDNDESVAGLGEDIAIVDLRPRGARGASLSSGAGACA